MLKTSTSRTVLWFPQKLKPHSSGEAGVCLMGQNGESVSTNLEWCSISASFSSSLGYCEAPVRQLHVCGGGISTRISRTWHISVTCYLAVVRALLTHKQIFTPKLTHIGDWLLSQWTSLCLFSGVSRSTSRTRQKTGNIRKQQRVPWQCSGGYFSLLLQSLFQIRHRLNDFELCSYGDVSFSTHYSTALKKVQQSVCSPAFHHGRSELEAIPVITAESFEPGVNADCILLTTEARWSWVLSGCRTTRDEWKTIYVLTSRT